MKTLYTAVANVSGGREGKGRTDDGRLEVSLSLPKEIGGNGGPGTNPEQLFAIGYAACFESALRYVGRAQKLKVDNASVTSRVSLITEQGADFQLAVELRVHVPGMEQAELERLVETAHGVCPYSRATRGNIEVKLSADTTGAPAA